MTKEEEKDRFKMHLKKLLDTVIRKLRRKAVLGGKRVHLFSDELDFNYLAQLRIVKQPILFFWALNLTAVDVRSYMSITWSISANLLMSILNKISYLSKILIFQKVGNGSSPHKSTFHQVTA